MSISLAFISLGCDKNLVDSEVMLGICQKAGLEVISDESKADIIVVNTCCFIQDALEESIETIVEKYGGQLDITYDDGIQHICRLMGTYKSIEEGQSFPVIMSAFCNGFGYSWNLFYSPFTAFAPLLFKWIGFSFAGCIKLFMFVVTFFT